MTKIDRIVMPRIFDAHVHFRTGSLMWNVVPHTTRCASRAVVMPNTKPAILTGDDVKRYRSQINGVLKARHETGFEPLMTFEVRDNTTQKDVFEAHRAGAVAGKVYPLGVTTNSDNGLRDFFSRQVQDTFRAMSSFGMLLLIHGEIDMERTLVTQREEAFLPTLVRLAEMFPKLRIVLEHVSTKAGVNTVMGLGENVAATITAHHLVLTLNNVIGDGIHPHHMCMPVPKDFDDRDALIKVATSGNRKFFLGSDSAPHEKGMKECAHGKCGVYSAPVLPEILAPVFENAGKLNYFAWFTSWNGEHFYRLKPNESTITLVRKDWTVPNEIGGVVPFCAGQTLRWKMQTDN